MKDLFLRLYKIKGNDLGRHLSKEAVRNIAYKQIMWRVYINPVNIEYNNNYKKALNLAISKSIKSKRSFEQQLANDIQKMKARVSTTLM